MSLRIPARGNDTVLLHIRKRACGTTLADYICGPLEQVDAPGRMQPESTPHLYLVPTRPSQSDGSSAEAAAS